ncbi:MAG TPA: 16S rRNA (cytosine(967)-C(5))-methyltransferase RsmB [Luteimonas sp.]|nr:16S rRNA (cytosine(967)-C(5))-methyltransferase RsmB [Luteimonas sp.]HRO26640.1 16S rRNA (cytosine(967)-C(5))-methyltransferase RsmB [Luteimonas sp.]HRP72897.1 16S rRNA (cytosine(967)-C(5))-methyltransferase RsmB [Luteimonas sp.]
MAKALQPGVEVRVAAARVLAAVLRGRSLKAELASALPKLADPRDRALLEAICFAALRQRARYDAALRAWMQTPPGAKDGELRALLLAGFAQLDAMELPAHAALSATVEATRALGRQHQAGMVNALLRRAQREGIPRADAEAAWPDWLRARVRADWQDDADAIFAVSAMPAPTWLRVNRGRTSVDAYAQRLREAGIEAHSADDLPDALRIDTPVSPTALPGFVDGDVSVQDVAAQRVADALSPPPGAPVSGRKILDACAAPGGKSAHLLERDPTLRLTALDVDERRLRRVRETFDRLGVGNDARLLAADATDTAAWWDGEPFDAILLDAPCSATGIVRRQPDVLLHRRESDLAALTALQARLLDALWPLLAPGGTLLYATCSILAAENQAQVAAFLARTPAARAGALPEAFGRDTGDGRQRLPGERGMDGFFYAIVTRA